MSKSILISAFAFATAAALSSCGGTTGGTEHTSTQEYDLATGSWKQPSKIVKAPPPQGGAVIADQAKPGVMKKVGDTLKKPLQWAGFAKDNPPSAPVPAGGQAPKP